MAIMDLISRIHFASFVIMLPKEFKYSSFSNYIGPIIILIGVGCLEILITLDFPHSFTFHSVFQFHLIYSSCPSTFSSLASSTRSSAYFTMRITCPPILNSPNPSRASLVRYSLYYLNRIDDKQQPCLTPLPIFTLLISPWSSRILTLCSMYNLLINILSRQSIPFPFRICINLVQLADYKGHTI
jgi:hypothetical protein